ncbi:lipocalin-like domain-containing protein [bacterium]|nr:lipocalin-like domain-containing protein [bacterium]MCI0697355.1 lipocalin-like domain-containing protein [candidate division KSB1 bacterium]
MNKPIQTYIWPCLMASFLALTFLLYAQDAQKSPSIVGTYKYVLEDQEGMSIITKTHVIWVLSDKNRKSFQGTEPTEAEKASAFTSAFADGGTYKFVGPSRITVHRLFSTNPNLVGQEFTFEYEFEGELCKYWILQPDGSRGTMGKAQRVEK